MNNQTGAEESNSFGDWLRRRRKMLDLTQAQLAQRAGCTAATIRKIEAGERKPSQQLAELLATALRVPDDARAPFLQAARQIQALAQLGPPMQAPLAASLLRQDSHNLPVPMTSLVNRTHDIATIAGLITRPEVRLLTLLGPPGIGKTRLCIHTAETVAQAFRDGVWFVDLAPVTDASLVLPLIAHLLSVAEVGETPLPERLRANLAPKELLLALDNFEQVSAAATDVADLLRTCKGLKLLVTSRVPLHLSAEHEYAVPPLSLPPLDSGPEMTPERLMEYEALQLFVARVRQHQHDFAITTANARQIVTICIQLDGIPLALELAAAALRHMTLLQLAAMLRDDANWLHALHSPSRDLPPRQRTLYQAIAWSYSLLDADVQSIFRRLGIFVGGFDAEAAQAVCGADQDTLELLTDHNLLARAPERWRMVEMIREFALAQMSSEEHTAVQRRHTAYFATHTAMNPAANLAAIARDHDNFRTALAAAIAMHDTQAALTLCLKLSWFWETHGHLREGMTLARAALAMPDGVDVRLRIDALERVCTLNWQVHQFDVARQFSKQINDLALSCGHQEEVARALVLQGRILIEQGDYMGAQTVLQESIQLARQIPHLYNPGFPLAQLGEVALARGDWEAAHMQLAQALALLAGDEESLATGIFIAMAHTDLAEIALERGDPEQARRELRQVLPYARLYMRRLHCLLVTLAGLLLTNTYTTQVEVVQIAAECLGAVAGVSDRTGDSLSPLHQALIAQRSERAQQLLTQQEWQAAWQVGHRWTLAQAGAEAEKWV